MKLVLSFMFYFSVSEAKFTPLYNQGCYTDTDIGRVFTNNTLVQNTSSCFTICKEANASFAGLQMVITWYTEWFKLRSAELLSSSVVQHLSVPPSIRLSICLSVCLCVNKMFLLCYCLPSYSLLTCTNEGHCDQHSGQNISPWKYSENINNRL